MTLKEFEKFADAIKTYFPRDNTFPTKESVRLWYEELKDLDYQMAAMELRKYVALNRFAPTIADIRCCLVDFAEKKELDAPQAWELVVEALKEVEASGMAKKKFTALPKLIKKAVGGYVQFLELSDSAGSRGIAKSNFIKSYEKLLGKELEMKKLQPEIRKAIENNGVTAIEQSVPLQIEDGGKEELIGDEWADI